LSQVMKQRNEAESTTRQMEDVRQLVLGKDNQRILDAVEKNARQLVSNVLTEALHDRQKNDGTVSKVLTPLIEKSVEVSVVARKEQFVSYLYPLVGSLVRKSVGAFLSGLIEQTNTLLESSLTYQGVKWRFKAKQAGVSYSQYVISQTFLYRVEQVLLIHHDTGLLLKTVFRDKNQTTDSDMVSAMLTAINDFVSDSFSPLDSACEQNLDEIKTDDFTLLIKQGPQAFIVAAISGKAPVNIGHQMQLTLEEIHRLYGEELTIFDGDSAPFENTEQQLTDCLLEQYKQTNTKKRKKPWFAIVLSFTIVSILGYVLLKQWTLDYQAWKIKMLPTAAGIILLKSERCDDTICVEVLRDPAAQEPLNWIRNTHQSIEHIKLTEHPYYSLESTLIHQRLAKIAKTFPELTFQHPTNQFSGELSPERYHILKMQVSAFTESQSLVDVLKAVTIIRPTMTDKAVNRQLLQKYIRDIERTSVSFGINQSELADSDKTTLTNLSKKIIVLIAIAHKLNQRIQFVVMGISDPIGSTDYNQALSAKRANTVKDALIKQGVAPDTVKSVGLGVLDSSHGSRRVIFSVIQLPPQHIEKVEE